MTIENWLENNTNAHQRGILTKIDDFLSQTCGYRRQLDELNTFLDSNSYDTTASMGFPLAIGIYRDHIEQLLLESGVRVNLLQDTSLTLMFDIFRAPYLARQYGDRNLVNGLVDADNEGTLANIVDNFTDSNVADVHYLIETVNDSLISAILPETNQVLQESSDLATLNDLIKHIPANAILTELMMAIDPIAMNASTFRSLCGIFDEMLDQNGGNIVAELITLAAISHELPTKEEVLTVTSKYINNDLAVMRTVTEVFNVLDGLPANKFGASE